MLIKFLCTVCSGDTGFADADTVLLRSALPRGYQTLRAPNTVPLIVSLLPPLPVSPKAHGAHGADPPSGRRVRNVWRAMECGATGAEAAAQPTRGAY